MGALEGKVAIITGASRGIGAETARAFARQGTDVVLAARTSEASPSALPGTIDGVARDVQALGRRALAVPTDVTKDDQVESMVARTLETFGRVDVLINNAGISFPASLADTPMRRWDLVMNVNLRATVLCTKAVLPHFFDRGDGCVINVSSYLAENFLPGMLSYTVSKIAIEKLTEGFAREVRDRSVAVSALRIEMNIATEGWAYRNPEADLSTWEKPEAAADAMVWLASQGRAVTGRVMTIAQVRDRQGIVSG